MAISGIDKNTFRLIKRFCLVLLLLILMSLSISLARGTSRSDQVDIEDVVARVPTSEVILQIQKKYKGNLKKYKKLADKLEKHVKKALEETYWRSGPGEGVEKPLSEHPYVLLVQELSQSAISESKERTNDDEVQKLLDTFPWSPNLELIIGLQGGSDRPIPKHTRGFIYLGEMLAPLPGFPELSINRYLYGTREIVNWQFCVEQKKSLAFSGRKKLSKKPAMMEELPPWESVQLYLDGILPDVALLAVPQMTHELHTRLVDKRRNETGELSQMDEMMAFMESKWNGFYFKNPYTKKTEPFVQSVHALVTERGSFAYRFPLSSGLASQGDLPFISDWMYQEHAKRYLGQSISIVDYVRSTEAARNSLSRFRADSTYLARYRCLIDLIVRSILVPNMSYPKYMSAFDYQGGKTPGRETGIADQDLDMPRKHALMTWAFVGKDIDRLADLLHRDLLAKPENQFPSNVSLPVQFTLHVRTNEQGIMDSIISRIRGKVATDSTIDGGEGSLLGDFEREFSPYLDYRTVSGSYYSDFLAASHHSFTAQVSQTVKKAAYEAVLKEIGSRWLR